MTAVEQWDFVPDTDTPSIRTWWIWHGGSRVGSLDYAPAAGAWRLVAFGRAIPLPSRGTKFLTSVPPPVRLEAISLLIAIDLAAFKAICRQRGDRYPEETA